MVEVSKARTVVSVSLFLKKKLIKRPLSFLCTISRVFQLLNQRSMNQIQTYCNHLWTDQNCYWESHLRYQWLKQLTKTLFNTLKTTETRGHRWLCAHPSYKAQETPSIAFPWVWKSKSQKKASSSCSFNIIRAMISWSVVLIKSSSDGIYLL